MSVKTKKKTLREIAKDLETSRRSTTTSELADRVLNEILRDLWSIARQAHGLDSAPENV